MRSERETDRKRHFEKRTGDGAQASGDDALSELVQPEFTPEPGLAAAAGDPELVVELLRVLCGRSDAERGQICFDLLSAAGARVWSHDYPGGRNIVSTFSAAPAYKRLFCAHYDRVPQAPGANDNGAAVAELVSTALELHAAGFEDEDLAIVLFDNEETMKREPETSGSLQFARWLKEQGIDPEFVLVLDVCGVGDVVGISASAPSSPDIKQRLRRELDCLYIPSLELWTPDSDSLMIGREGFDSVLICTVPRAGLATFESTVDPGAWNPANAPLEEWKRLHSARDDFGSVSPETLAMMQKLLKHLALS